MRSAFRVYLSENCNMKCPNCFNAGTRANAEMDEPHFLKICEYLKNNGISSLKLMGGEPTLNTDFPRLYSIAQKNFRNVVLFTNGTTKNLYRVFPRLEDGITYNFNFFKLWSPETLLLDRLGRRNLEIQVPNDKDRALEIISRIRDLHSWDPENTAKIVHQLTFDCTKNLFEVGAEYRESLELFESFFSETGYEYNFDHPIPFCIYNSTFFNTVCNRDCPGLIDAEYDLRFCNQKSEKLGHVFDDQGNLIPWKAVEEILDSEYLEKVDRIADRCKACASIQRCNGGCWHKFLKS